MGYSRSDVLENARVYIAKDITSWERYENHKRIFTS